MQHIFIVNNAAGRGDVVKRLLPQIRDYFSKHGGDYRIEFTRYKGDATEIARRYALTGEPVRIYSCGGDGTLNEVVNGIVGVKMSSWAHCPAAPATTLSRRCTLTKKRARKPIST